MLVYCLALFRRSLNNPVLIRLGISYLGAFTHGVVSLS